MTFLLSDREEKAGGSSHHEFHWGYGSRTLPCTKSAVQCEFSDATYWMHDVSMLYTFIMWGIFGGIFITFIFLRILKPRLAGSEREKGTESQGAAAPSAATYRIWRGAQALVRRWLLPECLTGYFGHVTRLQVLILTILTGYLLIFSLVGMVYKTWMTPSKVHGVTVYSTRTGLNGFANRMGAFAFALTPLAVILCTRESILSLATRIPCQSFNFLHRWLGRIIFMQLSLHVFGWTLIEAYLYKPQPTKYKEFIVQAYIIWGCFAFAFICFLFVFSLRPVIKLTGHEFFRKAHYVVACLYIGASIGHWKLLDCWMIASLAIYGLDRGVRLLRTFLIHNKSVDGSKGLGFHPAQSTLQYFDDEDGGIVRMEFDQISCSSDSSNAWEVGQHFYLCFPALTVWQSHPLTVGSVPKKTNPRHMYIIRCRKGETGRLKTLALHQNPVVISPGEPVTTPVILCGPYGKPLLPSAWRSAPERTNVLAIAGGTGVSLTLPLVQAATSTPEFMGPAVDFIWIIRRSSNMKWIASELDEMKRVSGGNAANLNIHIYVTQEALSASNDASLRMNEKSDEENCITREQSKGHAAISEIGIGGARFDITYLDRKKPSLGEIVKSFMETRADTSFRTRVVASGPNIMGKDLRSAVARQNDAGKVMKGEKRWDVELEWDDRTG